MINAHVPGNSIASSRFLKIQFFNVEELDLLVVCQSQLHLTYLSWQKSQNWCSNLVTGLVKVWTKFCVHSFITGEKSHMLFLSYYLFLLLLLCIEKIFTPLIIHFPFQRKIAFADPDWIGFHSDIDSSSNGKNSKLGYKISSIWWSRLICLLCIKNTSKYLLKCTNASLSYFRGRALLPTRVKSSGFRSDAHLSSNG